MIVAQSSRPTPAPLPPPQDESKRARNATRDAPALTWQEVKNEVCVCVCVCVCVRAEARVVPLPVCKQVRSCRKSSTSFPGYWMLGVAVGWKRVGVGVGVFGRRGCIFTETFGPEQTSASPYTAAAPLTCCRPTRATKERLAITRGPRASASAEGTLTAPPRTGAAVAWKASDARPERPGQAAPRGATLEG